MWGVLKLSILGVLLVVFHIALSPFQNIILWIIYFFVHNFFSHGSRSMLNSEMPSYCIIPILSDVAKVTALKWIWSALNSPPYPPLTLLSLACNLSNVLWLCWSIICSGWRKPAVVRLKKKVDIKILCSYPNPRAPSYLWKLNLKYIHYVWRGKGGKWQQYLQFSVQLSNHCLCVRCLKIERKGHMGYQSGKGVDNANQLPQWRRELSWLLKLITYRYSELISIYTVWHNTDDVDWRHEEWKK
jgi:hypothetical protein